MCLSLFGQLQPNTADWVASEQQRFFFLMILEAGKSKIRGQHGWIRALFWVADSSCPSMVEEMRELCGVSLLKKNFF